MSPLVRLLRPKQWIKNAFVFAPLFFAQRFADMASWQQSGLAALGFLSISCMVYIGNDLRDIEEDRLHPTKKKRPLASGEISATQARLMALLFAGLSLLAFAQLPAACGVIAVIYVVCNILYTLWLKHVALIDIFLISSFYVLRVLMGGYALEVFISPWIILTTFLLALFLGFGKRYHEVGFEEYSRQKLNLQHYNRDLLDHLVTISGGAALIAYAIYATEMARQIGKLEMVYTIAFVAFGLFRYLQSIYVYGQGGEPETVLLKDKLQIANIFAWLVLTLWIISA